MVLKTQRTQVSKDNMSEWLPIMVRVSPLMPGGGGLIPGGGIPIGAPRPGGIPIGGPIGGRMPGGGPIIPAEHHSCT